MSKVIKQMQMDHIRKEFDGVRDLVVVSIKGLDCHADGLLRAGPPAPRSGEPLTFELRNADGGEAEMSGNGIRCLAQAAVESGLVKPPALRRNDP